jgi:DNA segregation ATPase FtsK/SpoIIIE, S-DNA-T family
MSDVWGGLTNAIPSSGPMNKRQLYLQADRIETVLLNHKAPARVTGGRVTPRTIQFHLQLAPATKVGKVEALNDEIALALDAPAARVNRSNGRINIEVPRKDSTHVGFLDLAKRLSRDRQLERALQVPGTGLLGLDTEGIPLLVRLASPDVTHILIAGTTGSGKTEVTRTILASLVYFQKPREIQLLLVDPKGRAFRLFEELPHMLSGTIRTPEGTCHRLRWLEAEMERRQEAGITCPRIVLVLDELADLLIQGGQELQVHLARLVQRGRSAGISIIACTQKPTSSAIGSLIKANFPVRLVGKVTSADEARVAGGVGGTGAERLAGRGDFVLVAGSEMVHFQAAYLAPDEYGAFRETLASRAKSGDYRSDLRGLISRITRVK